MGDVHDLPTPETREAGMSQQLTSAWLARLGEMQLTALSHNDVTMLRRLIEQALTHWREAPDEELAVGVELWPELVTRAAMPSDTEPG